MRRSAARPTVRRPRSGIAQPSWPTQAPRRASGTVPPLCRLGKTPRVLLESAGPSLVYDVARLDLEHLATGALPSRHAGAAQEGIVDA
jgi:hypothetical protein